jgi:DNA primase large subunit
MDIVLDRKELIKYPFLKESQELARRHVESLEEFLESSPGAVALARAKERVIAALTFKKEFGDETTQNLKPELEIASYALARMLVSCINDRSLIDRLARYEAERASFFLAAEDPEIRRFVAWSIGINTGTVTLPVTGYVELVPHLRDKRWRLVNRDVQRGSVALEPGEIDELIRERIRAILVDQLPLRVPHGLCERFGPVTGEIRRAAAASRSSSSSARSRRRRSRPASARSIQAITAGTN